MICLKNPSLVDRTFSDSEEASYLFTSLSDTSLHYQIKDEAEVDLTLIDLSSEGADFHLVIDLFKGAKLHLQIASFLFKEKNKSINILVNHLEGDSLSRITFAGVNSSSASLVFRGTSDIVNGAKRSDTRQEGRINNLKAEAKSEVSPLLLIKENDVSASHGAAVGSYNPDEIFYLMSRGLSFSDSKKLIIKGTLLPIIKKLTDENLLNEALSFFEELEL